MLEPAEANRRSLDPGLEKPTLGHLGPMGTLAGQKLSLDASVRHDLGSLGEPESRA